MSTSAEGHATRTYIHLQYTYFRLWHQLLDRLFFSQIYALHVLPLLLMSKPRSTEKVTGWFCDKNLHPRYRRRHVQWTETCNSVASRLRISCCVYCYTSVERFFLVDVSVLVKFKNKNTFLIQLRNLNGFHRFYMISRSLQLLGKKRRCNELMFEHVSYESTWKFWYNYCFWHRLNPLNTESQIFTK